jgi:hypothetical protein
VKVQDGLFTLFIDVSTGAQTPLTFDEPYFLEILIGDSNNGGKVGQQVFHSFPYAFGSENTLGFNSLEPESFTTIGHPLTRLEAGSFLIDGSAETKANADQLTLRNDSSGTDTVVFRVDEDGRLQSVRNISVTSTVESGAALDVRRTNSTETEVSVVKLSSSGDLIAMDPEFPGRLSVGKTLNISGSLSVPDSLPSAVQATHTVVINGDLVLTELLQFTSGSTISVLGSTNPLGAAHLLEEHLVTETSTTLSKFQTLVSNELIDSSLHSHLLVNGEIDQFNNEAIDGDHIADGTLKNEDFQSTDAGELIEDSKLATLSTPGVIALSAVPAQAVRTDLDNDLTRVFPQTLVNFDRLKSKTFTISSTRSDTNVNAFPLLEFSDGDGNAFGYNILSNGDLTYFSNKSNPVATFGFINAANKDDDLQLRSQNLEFTDLDGGTSLSFFNGTMIQDGTIQGADLSAGAVDQNLLKDFDDTDPNSGVGTLNIATGAVGTSQMFGSLTSRVFSSVGSPNGAAMTSGKIEAGTMQSAAFASSSVITTDLADAAVAFDDFASGSVAEEDLVDRAVTNDKLFSGLSTSDLLQNDDFADATLSALQFSTATATGSLIENDQLSVTVLSSRTVPMKITTAVTEMLVLRNTNAVSPMTFLELDVVNFNSANDYRSALEIKDSNSERVNSLNNNGTISMSISTGNLVPVTLETPLMASWFRTGDVQGNCGVKDSKTEPLVGSGADLRSDCISKVANHGLVPLAFFDALSVCQSDGYQLCDVNQVAMSCSQGKLTTGESLLLRDMGGTNTAVTFRVLDGTCNSSDDYDFVSVNATSATTGFRCCLK